MRFDLLGFFSIIFDSSCYRAHRVRADTMLIELDRTERKNLSNSMEFDGAVHRVSRKTRQHIMPCAMPESAGKISRSLCNTFDRCATRRTPSISLEYARTRRRQHIESARVRWNVANRAWSNSIKIDRTCSCNISNLLEFDGM